MQVSRELDYSIRAIVILATDPVAVMSKRTIASRFCIPVNFLSILLPKLVHAGIVESLPGPRGGYRLAKPASAITILDVIRAVERPLAVNHCLDAKRGCDQKEHCPVSRCWEEVQDRAVDYLSSVTFERLASDYREAQ